MSTEPLLLAILAIVAVMLLVIHRLRGSGMGSAPDRGKGDAGSHTSYIGGDDGGGGGGGDGGGGD